MSHLDSVILLFIYKCPLPMVSQPTVCSYGREMLSQLYRASDDTSFVSVTQRRMKINLRRWWPILTRLSKQNKTAGEPNCYHSVLHARKTG